MTIPQRRTSDNQDTILCIDDESDNLRILSNLFKNNYQVVLCKHAQKAVELAKQHQPSLILLDVVMPEIDGFELLKQFRDDPDTKTIPIIFITGLNDLADEEKGLKLGACDYIHKPFQPSIVRARVNAHLEIMRQRRLLERLAHIDALTELPNRRQWDQDIEVVMERSKSSGKEFTIGIIDIDHFKLYNDHYGHPQGDITLRKISNAVARALYDFSGQIYRCGGEEFFFFIPETKELSVSVILQKALDSVKELEIEHKISPTSPFVTISLGAVNASSNIEVDDLIQQADKNLYNVKNSSRNGICLSQD